MELNRIEKTRTRLKKEGKRIINLSSGSPGESGVVFPPEILEEGFRNFQNNPKYSPDPKGDFSARGAIKKFYETRGFRINTDNILVTSGTSESYLHMFRLLGGKDGEILFPNPGYPLFDHIAAIANVSLGHYQLDASNNWQVDVRDLESNISEKTRAIVLISPNNPTGGVLTKENLEAVLFVAEKHRLAVISDEVFSEFVYDDEKFPRVAAMEKTSTHDVDIFTLSGISKTYALPGLKLGWIVATGPNAPRYLDELELSVDTFLAANQLSQSMLPVIMEKGNSFVLDYRKRLEESRKIAMKILGTNDHITFSKPMGGLYLFAQIHGYHGSDEDFVIELMEQTGIFVHPGYFYDYEKGLHVLISFVMEAGRLRQVLEQFVQFVTPRV